MDLLSRIVLLILVCLVFMIVAIGLCGGVYLVSHSHSIIGAIVIFFSFLTLFGVNIKIS